MLALQTGERTQDPRSTLAEAKRVALRVAQTVFKGWLEIEVLTPDQERETGACLLAISKPEAEWASKAVLMA